MEKYVIALLTALLYRLLRGAQPARVELTCLKTIGINDSWDYISESLNYNPMLCPPLSNKNVYEIHLAHTSIVSKLT